MQIRDKNKLTHPSIFRRIWAFWFAFVIVILFLILYPWFLITLSFPKLYPLAHKGRYVWGKLLFLFTGMRLEATWEVPFDKDKTYIIVANHSSYLDIPTTTLLVKKHFIFMAKMELAKIPLFGIFFKTMDIAVDRKNAIKANASFKNAVDQLSNGTSVMLFPEGTIHKSAPEISKFKDGPFKAAILSKTHILPINFLDNWWHLPDNTKFSATPGKLRAYIHAPIDASNYTVEQTQELKLKVFEIIKKYNDENNNLNNHR